VAVAKLDHLALLERQDFLLVEPYNAKAVLQVCNNLYLLLNAIVDWLHSSSIAVPGGTSAH